MADIEPTFGDGRYIIRRELGRGTMGVVYEAEDALLARTVAVKTIDVAFAIGERERGDFERRFFTEARVAAGLSHPGIVVCHDVDKDAASGRLFIVFEYLKGRTLAERADDGPMRWREALAVVVQVARAIHHAHQHGVVHRDLKPANIMLLDPGTAGTAGARGESAVKIMDFGVARLESPGQRITRTGQAFGSPLYMSPEQALGQPSSARSDIFSVGSVLCTLVLGRPWFDAPSLPKIVDRVVNEDSPRLSSLTPGVPGPLDAVVAMALAKRETDRYASASDLADDLEDLLAGKPPRHAAIRASGRAPDDALLAGLTLPSAGRRGLPSQDPLASLLDESAPPPRPAAAETTPIVALATQPTSAGHAPTARRWLLPAGALLGLAAVAVAFVPRRGSAPRDAEAPPSLAAAAVPTPTPIAQGGAVPPTTTTVPAAAGPPPTTALPATVAPIPSTAPAVPPSTVAVQRPRPTATPTVQAVPPVAPVVESPASGPDAGEASVPTSPSEVPGSRMRLSVEHPFEDGRLILWIDGVLVHDAKLEASMSRRIVGFKVREGRTQTLLDVDPGPHEVRVEVTWEQGRRASSKVIDVAPHSTGLLEVKVGRMNKGVNLAWSRLARE